MNGIFRIGLSLYRRDRRTELSPRGPVITIALISSFVYLELPSTVTLGCSGKNQQKECRTQRGHPPSVPDLRPDVFSGVAVLFSVYHGLLALLPDIPHNAEHNADFN